MKEQLEIEWEKEQFVDILFGAYENNEGFYLKLSPPEQLIDTLNSALETYNLSSGKS